VITNLEYKGAFKVAQQSDFFHSNQESLKVHISANTWWIFKIQYSSCS